MTDMELLRIMTICLAVLLPGFYYILSASIQRASLFFSITLSIYLSLEFLYFSELSSLTSHRVIAIVGVSSGCFLIHWCRIKLMEFIFNPVNHV